MTGIGEVALWVALLVSVWGMGMAFVGGRAGQDHRTRKMPE